MSIKHYIAPVILALFVALPSVGYAQTTPLSVDALLAQIQTLMAQIEELQKKMGQAQTELRTLLKDNLREGMTDEDIKKVQELLATDPDIYPRGLVTGYFGPMTKDALKRFQQKFSLKITGEIDEETRAYLEELLKERFGDKIPPGLLRAPGIQKKVELRMKEGCDGGLRGSAFLCQELKIRLGDDDSDDEDNDEDDNSGLEIEVEIEDGQAKVKIEYENGVKRMFILDTTDHDEIVEEIVDRTTLTEDEINEVIEFEEEDDEDEEDDSEDDGDEDDDGDDDDDDN